MDQHEISESGPLLNERGMLRARGWARRPLLSYDRSSVAAPLRRIKEGDCYCIFTQNFAVFFAVEDSGSIGSVSLSVIDFVKRREVTEHYLSLFPLGSFALPASSEKGDVRLRHKSGAIDFAVMEGGSRIIKVDFSNFDRGSGLRGALVLSECAGGQSIVTAMNQPKKRTSFLYNRKSPCFTAEGVMQYGDAELVFPKGESFCVFSWKRSVRPCRDSWYWISASGSVDGHLFGFIIAYGSGDDSSGSENALFWDGVLHKLGAVSFQSNPRDWLKPWRFSSEDGRLEMTLNPLLDSISVSRALIYTSTHHRIWGRFSGKAVLDDGQVVEFSELTGFAEKAKRRW